MRTTKELEQCLLHYRQVAEDCVIAFAESGKVEVVFGQSKQDTIDHIFKKTEEWIEKLKKDSNA